jgi:hypothetical protein
MTIARSIFIAVALSIAAAAASPRPGQGQPTPAGDRSELPVQFDRFSARRERTAEGERLSVALRLRTGSGKPLACFVFVVLRNDDVTPKVWAVWPPQEPGRVLSAGGHFHGANPELGMSVTLTDEWQRVTASVEEEPGRPRFNTAVVYVVTGSGQTLLVRPFRV